MKIRQATTADVDAVMHLLDIGRQRMEAVGNTHQWVKGYPRRTTVEEDVRREQCFVGEREGRIVAAFVLASGPDPLMRASGRANGWTVNGLTMLSTACRRQKASAACLPR